jgi:D-alanyl-D-alanine carboxypeptidase
VLRAPVVATVPPTPPQIANGPVRTGPPPKPLAVQIGHRNLIDPHFKVQPRGGLLFDLDSGELLWEHRPTRILPIASLTKMMTALLAAERLPSRTTVKVTREALAYKGSGVGVLPKGKRVGAQAMLYGLLLPSGNDAAIALSQRISGTLRRFVDAMNAKADEMDLGCTHFTRPDGFQDTGNHSCAYDLAALARAVLDQPRLARIVRAPSANLPFPIKGGRLYLYNNNPLLRMRYRGTIGIKTGYTEAAGHCLVAAVRRGHRRLGLVLLHSPNTGDQAKTLFDLAFRRLARTR